MSSGGSNRVRRVFEPGREGVLNCEPSEAAQGKGRAASCQIRGCCETRVLWAPCATWGPQVSGEARKMSCMHFQISPCPSRFRAGKFHALPYETTTESCASAHSMQVGPSCAGPHLTPSAFVGLGVGGQAVAALATPSVDAVAQMAQQPRNTTAATISVVRRRRLRLPAAP